MNDRNEERRKVKSPSSSSLPVDDLKATTMMVMMIILNRSCSPIFSILRQPGRKVKKNSNYELTCLVAVRHACGG